MKNLIFLIFLGYSSLAIAQIGIGTPNPHPSAIVDVESSTKGFLPPVMSNSQIEGISNAATGLIAYSTDENCLVYFDGSNWINLCENTELNPQTDFTASPVRLKANNIDAADLFGRSIALSGDGNTLAVGAPEEDSNNQGVDNDLLAASGAVYIYRKVGGVWGAPLRLKASNLGGTDKFGISVTLSEDGNTLVVGSDLEDSDGSGADNNNIGNSGAVYVYKFTGGSWSSATRLKADNPGNNDEFGFDISLSDDGNTLAVGATEEDSDGSGPDNNIIGNSGAVYVFNFTGGSWSSATRLKADNVGQNDRFGISVSLSGDGNSLAVGAFLEDSDAQGVDNNAAANSGAVYVFRYSGGVWNTPTRLKADNISSQDQFGISVSLNGNGNTLAVGAYEEDSDAVGVDNSGLSNSGAVYVFNYSGTWNTGTRLKSNNIGSGDNFGFHIDISEDGNTLAVGAYGEDSDAQGVDNNSANGAGAVYILRNDGGTWNVQTRLKANNVTANDFFGYRLSLSNDGNSLAVGAHQEDSSVQGVDDALSSNSGAVYTFE